ncbi:MAG: LysR family transcriptional regulator [Aliidongia sp.]
MQLVQIRYFLAACETTNFSLAAKACHVTQPALTRSIQALERELGGLLFLREHHQTRLTLFGQLMRTHFERIHRDTEALRESALRHRLEEGHRLNIGVMKTVGAEPLSEILREFGLENRSVLVTIVEGTHERLTEQLIEGSIHLALMSGAVGPRDSDLRGLPLVRESFAIAFRADHRFRSETSLSLADIAQERHVAETGCSMYEQLREACAAEGHSLSTVMETERSDWLQPLVAAGLGIALVSDSTALLPGLMTRPISGLSLERDIEIVAVADREPVEPAARFLRVAGLARVQPLPYLRAATAAIGSAAIGVVSRSHG